MTDWSDIEASTVFQKITKKLENAGYEQLINVAIHCAMAVSRKKYFILWANEWLNKIDRSHDTAYRVCRQAHTEQSYSDVRLNMVGLATEKAAGATFMYAENDMVGIRKDVELAIKAAMITAEGETKSDLIAIIDSFLNNKRIRLEPSKIVGDFSDIKHSKESLIEVLKDTNNDHVTITIAICVICTIGASCVEPLVKLLGDKNEEVIANAAVALVHLGEPALKTLTRTMTKKNADRKVIENATKVVDLIRYYCDNPSLRETMKSLEYYVPLE